MSLMPARHRWEWQRCGHSSKTSWSSQHASQQRDHIALNSAAHPLAACAGCVLRRLCPSVQPLLSASIQFHPFVSFLRSELARLQPALSSPAVSSASVLHGDLFLENVLFSTDGQLLALIDWEELCSGPRLLDAAMTVVGCCYTARQQLDEQLTTAFLSQYCSRHPLSAAECELLLDFVCYACLSIAFWRFRQFNVRVVDPARTGAYEQMVQRIERLRADGPDRQCVQRILQTLLRAAQPL